ncbi:MAG: DISARM system SNF2-like helicase DrmD [Chloroflexota bacterium]
MSISNKPIPEQGQIVSVRQHRFVVAAVQSSALTDLSEQPQHLVLLNSIEDDALGENLQVVWEIEPDARIDERVGLPEATGFDSPKKFDAFLNAVRWGAISSADVRLLQSPFRSGITIEDYQLDPLVRAVQMPRANLLIADDVGMGKTIETGLIVQELLLRNRARTILIVCPSSLQIQWRDQMRDKFGLEFRIVDSEMMRGLRRSRGLHTNPWSHFPRLISSIDFIKRDRPMRLLKELLPAEGESKYPRKFDILVIDEAHNCAPVGGGRYATDSLRTEAIRTLAPHFEHKLFLTATPHNGYRESFSALMELLDDQRFARGVTPDRQQLQAVMVRRMKSELPPMFDGTPRFPAREIQAIEVPYTKEEREAHAWLREYSELRQKNTKDSTEQYATEFVLKLLKKRLFSSPAAFLTTLQKHESSLNAVRQKESEKKPKVNFGILRQQLDQAEQDDSDDDDTTSDALSTASTVLQKLSTEETELLKKMRTWAEKAERRADSKMQELLNWLRRNIKVDGKWTNERIVIFTEYRTTLNWLQHILATEGFTEEGRLMTLYGGMESDKREAIKAAFQTAPDKSAVRILLATDAASEGIDLQNHCHQIFHMEIPWNPNRLEQRNGRIDRHGQKKNVFVYHFVSKGYSKQTEILNSSSTDVLDADLEFLMVAVRKVEQIREDLGKVGPVIALQVEEAMLGRRSRLQTEQAEKDSEPVRHALKFERDLRTQIARHMEQLQETRHDLNFSSENIVSVVQTALELAEQRPLIEKEIEGLWTRKANRNMPCPVFDVPALNNAWATCLDGLIHPHTQETRPIVFDQNLIKDRDDIVLAHLNHKLVQMSLRLLRAEIWSPRSKKGLHRITARLVPDTVLDSPAVIAHARLVVIGGDQYRLHEEIITAGGFLREGRFARMNVGQISKALENALENEPSKEMNERLLALYEKIMLQLMLSLEARRTDRMEGVLKLLEERRDLEAANIESILNELLRSIEKELDEPEVWQMELPTLEENTQRSRDFDALRRRLQEIPNEINAEKEQIRKRFADPQPRMFPVAVTFLVPEKLAK